MTNLIYLFFLLIIAFPIGRAVGITIAVTFSLVGVSLLTLLILSFLHIKKRSALEIEFLWVNFEQKFRIVVINGKLFLNSIRTSIEEKTVDKLEETPTKQEIPC